MVKYGCMNLPCPNRNHCMAYIAFEASTKLLIIIIYMCLIFLAMHYLLTWTNLLCYYHSTSNRHWKVNSSGGQRASKRSFRINCNYKYLPENYRRTYYNSYNSKLICTHIYNTVCIVYVGMCVCVCACIIQLYGSSIH